MRIGRKWTISMLLAILVSTVLTCSAFAVPDLNRTGSISLTMKYHDEIAAGGNLVLYQVGTAVEEDGSYSFVCSGAFSGCGLALNDLESRRLISQLSEFAEQNHVSGTEKNAAADGTIVFDDLQPGVYLLKQTQAAEGFQRVNPFLVSIPMSVNGTEEYDVDAGAKMALTPVGTNDNEPNGNNGRGGTGSNGNGSVFPQTGQLKWPIPPLTIAGLLLFSLGWYLKFGIRSGGHAE